MIALENLDNKKLILIVLAGLAIAYLDFTFIIGAQRTSITNTAGESMKLKQGIANFNTEYSNMRQIKDKKDKLAKSEMQRSKRLVTEEELPLLMQNISSLANNNQVKIMRLTPAKEAKVKEGKPSEAGSDTRKPEATLITMEVVGDYHNFGAFINDLENSKDFMEIEALKITQNQADYSQQNLAMTVRTYVKK